MSADKHGPQTVEEALHGLSAGKVLDVATGSGGFVEYLIENLGDFEEITGIDSSAHALEAARKRLTLENIFFLRMDAARMYFADSHFDTVCIANSLHHMSDLPAVLAEMRRVCNARGQIIISEMYCDGQGEAQLSHVYLHHWWAAVDRIEGITHHETYERQQLVEMIEQLGLRSLEYYELVDEESNPKEPEMIHDLDEIIQRYTERLKAHTGVDELLRRGEELRQRVHQVGFRGSNSIIAIGHP